MQNVIFSTTRQWNPGDEFILAGVRNVFARLDVRHNPVIFNRNPDVRSCFQDRQIFKSSWVPNDFTSRPESIALEANLKFGFFDNSLKPHTNCSFADWVVLAGTPEWCNGKTYDLYANILEYGLPVMILGVGGGCDLYHEAYGEVIAKAKALTVRDGATLRAATERGFNARYLPCPALLAAPEDRERKIDGVKKIGLIYHACREESVIWNGFSREAYTYTADIYRRILAHYAGRYEFSMICHYVDELAPCRRDFPGMETLYSFDAADYPAFYAECDLVVGPRVHGIGMAASLGIPGVAFVHDGRGSTCEGFMARMHCIGDDVGQVLFGLDEEIEKAAARNSDLLAHKKATMESYVGIVGKAMENPEVSYSGRIRRDMRNFDLSEAESLLGPLHALAPDVIPEPRPRLPQRLARKAGKLLGLRDPRTGK